MKLVLKRGLPFLPCKTTSIFLNAKMSALTQKVLEPQLAERLEEWPGGSLTERLPFSILFSKQLLQTILAQMELRLGAVWLSLPSEQEFLH